MMKCFKCIKVHRVTKVEEIKKFCFNIVASVKKTHTKVSMANSSNENNEQETKGITGFGG